MCRNEVYYLCQYLSEFFEKRRGLHARVISLLGHAFRIAGEKLFFSAIFSSVKYKQFICCSYSFHVNII